MSMILKRNKLVVAKLECNAAISMILLDKRITHFKIGKTAGDVQSRYDTSEEYRDEYDEIKTVYTSEDKVLIDDLERVLISDYMQTYPTRCDNRKIGGGPECADSEDATASIYVVVKYKSN